MRNLLWEQEDPKIEELQIKEADSVVKQKRNEIKRLAKQKGYKFSYWQTANRNAKTVYTTYGVFPRDEKRPVSFEGCEFTKGFSGYPGATTTIRGGEYKALQEIEKYLNDQEDFMEDQNIFDYHQKRIQQATERMPPAMRGVMGDYRAKKEDDERWRVIGSFDFHGDYQEALEEWQEIGDDPYVDYLDLTDESGDTRDSIMRWGKSMGFKFIADTSHHFGGYFDTNGVHFMGAADDPEVLIMFPKGSTLSESRKRIQSLLSKIR